MPSSACGSSKAGAVPHRGWHRDDRNRDQPANHGRQGALHTCAHDNAVRGRELILDREQPMQARHADVVKPQHMATEKRCGNRGFFGDWHITSAGT